MGRVYYLSSELELIGEGAVRYEIKPWLSAFEVEGFAICAVVDEEAASISKAEVGPEI